MNREEFHARVAPLDDQKLRKVLWTLYWRGSATLRRRIENEFDVAEHGGTTLRPSGRPERAHKFRDRA